MMRSYSLSELAKVCDAELLGEDHQVSKITTDSREAGPDALFVALKGERFDAHQFVSQVAEAGAAGALVSEEQPGSISQIKVADRLVALGKLGHYNRQQYSGALVAVTGSAGKTSVKEMLALMFSSIAPTLATKGNLNNEIGAPLTLLELSPEHQYAVIELGASGLGEIARTVAMAEPDVAILNNAMAAHVEGFGSLANIVQAKAEIYGGLKESGVGIVNLDDPHSSVWSRRLNQLKRKTLTFGVHPSADVRADSIVAREDGCFNFRLCVQGRAYSTSLNVMGRHMISNALAAVAAWVALGLEPQDALKPLSEYRGFKGRLQLHQIGDQLQVVDDSYNANPGSMRAAIDVLMSLPGPHTLVIGAMAELGHDEQDEHRQLGKYAAKAGVERIIATGELMRHCVDAAVQQGAQAEFFESHQELLQALDGVKHGAVLVKGSRSTGMDKIVTALLDRDV